MCDISNVNKCNAILYVHLHAYYMYKLHMHVMHMMHVQLFGMKPNA